MKFSKEEFLPFISFKTSRSGGKGGQNVNKVSTKVELNFDLEASVVFNEEQKLRIRNKLANRVNAEGMIQVISEEERSQLRNKERSVEKLIYLLQNAMHQQKPRKATKPSRKAKEQRLKEKRMVALKKINRNYGVDN